MNGNGGKCPKNTPISFGKRHSENVRDENFFVDFFTIVYTHEMNVNQSSFVSIFCCPQM